MKKRTTGKEEWKRHSEGVHVGIDAGSVSVNCIVLNGNKEIVYESPYRRHLGKVEEATRFLFRELLERFGKEHIRSVSFTGNHGKGLSEEFGVFYEFDTISQVLGVLHVIPGARTIISMGGQDTALLQIAQGNGGWELEYFNTNGPCASGTGSFVDQQAQRLATAMYSSDADISQDQLDRILGDFIQLGLKSEKPANVACRCTVFTKSDMIHLQNKGEKLEDIIYGLHVGNARNYMSTIVSTRSLNPPVVFIGGLSLNALQIASFREYFPELVIPPYPTSLGALGVVLQALESGAETRLDPELVLGPRSRQGLSIPVAARLILNETTFPENNDVSPAPLEKGTRAYLGIDVGSTTTKYAVIEESAGKIIHKSYIPTQGKPIEVTQRLLKALRAEIGGKIDIVGVATTGSGRNVVGDFLNADLIIDEITAHARGAVEIDPRVDTIFEIGGQDSKYISIVNTHPLDFDMNKVCAAGTGSFLHELANKYGINIVGEFQDMALSSEGPVKLAERCTVFMESDLVSYHQRGASKPDLMAGLCYAIVYNYLNRVVGKRRLGDRVMFLGGPSLNKAVVAAFENVLGRGLNVPRHREVLGAYGAALSVRERQRANGKTESGYRGLRSAIDDRMGFVEKVCQADPGCHNQCKLKIYDFDGRRSIWGGECGRYDVTRSKGGKKENFFDLRQKVWEQYMAGVYEELGEEPIFEVDGRPTVGLQRSLYGCQTSVLWAHFFDRLGYRMVITPPTDGTVSKLGIESAVAETCYPVKVSHGHVSRLAGMTKYLFIPSMITMSTPQPSETGFYCPLLQGNSFMVRMALGLDKGSILNPVVHFKYDPDLLAAELSEQLQEKLGVGKSAIKKALTYALERHKRFIEALRTEGRRILEEQNAHEPLVIVTGRPYNLYDERLNLRLGRNFAKLGVRALPMDFIDVDEVELQGFPNMYWGLGAQILRSAEVVRTHSNYFGLHLTNFGCGADSFIEHFYRHIMGDKAHLILELDEHSAVAGVMTRLEAYKNVIDNTMNKLKVNHRLDEKIAG
jgi:predicted CoA-substrate-specific enzyme activase